MRATVDFATIARRFSTEGPIAKGRRWGSRARRSEKKGREKSEIQKEEVSRSSSVVSQKYGSRFVEDVGNPRKPGKFDMECQAQSGRLKRVAFGLSVDTGGGLWSVD